MSSREEFEKEMCNEYLWFGEALELAHFHGDDATGYYTGGGYIYDGTSCAEALFWAWRGWQASKTKSQSQLTALTTQLESVVAEHAALSKFIDDECYVYGPHDVEPVDAALEKPETPATSAFLAEVRASARNDFIGRIEWIIRNECNPDKTEAIINELQNFSDQLKLEAAQ
ncbi:hypothetical protein [Lelliottia amnigena]|uniref:hypothetical protein n=1 Tax=Lelliottia amnigena TaxID=61646 RepID=UPI001EF8C52A|nr:hypothetical protein [Lelliottia amnigena]MCG7781029.1 hypothetical protein [Lelliottia amnigena]